ncbi:GNAT family N-acetyltransferase [Streptomyces sp. NPDC058195]|uniref:GNAT family N-acetyltransferase n=1 Tax=Streptomyces sp. NPDC058195 TaxID=3346375 RepID=UPI0036EA92D2
MTETEQERVSWPPAPIRTERLVLRAPETRDRAAFIDLFSSPEVGTYLGGARSREACERTVPETPERRPGLFVIERDGTMIGTLELNRRPPELRSDTGPKTEEDELGYLLLPEAWGHGYAAEACAAALAWYAVTRPGASVVLHTQTANARSMRLASKLGFTEVQRYEAWGAPQWMGRMSPVAPPA